MIFKRSFVFSFIFISLFFTTGMRAWKYASASPFNRQTEIVVPYTEYEWWLVRWSTNTPVCQILVDHNGLPTQSDVFVYCGSNLYEEWLDTSACEPMLEGEQPSSCPGLYLQQVTSEPKEKIVMVDLPLPEVWIAVEGCNPLPTDNRCQELPSLLITATEPLPNERITFVQGTYNGIPFYCEGDTCKVPLRPTPEEGAEVTFWADSSFGDSSRRYSALVRVVDAGVSSGPGSGGWFVNVMSDRLDGPQAMGCGPVWGSFPPIENLPSWLDSPEWPELLSSDAPYMYLAGRLIYQGIVDARDCPNGGLETNGYANACGLERARPEVSTWQNRFDEQIVTVARDTGIPAQLMKNLFAQESQFWPGVFNQAEEFGLGQLTELGADTVLLWNTTFYSQFCPLVLNKDVCDAGYASLSDENQAILRGALTIKVNADCPDCPMGIDLYHATFSIDYFAQTIYANCQQTGQIIKNHRGKSPGMVARYEDLWRFTLANYHAGPGCLSNAIQALGNLPLTWENLAPNLENECPGVQDYVESIAR